MMVDFQDLLPIWPLGFHGYSCLELSADSETQADLGDASCSPQDCKIPSVWCSLALKLTALLRMHCSCAAEAL